MKTPFWVVWSPRGKQPPYVRHTARVIADTEAERLAKLVSAKQMQKIREEKEAELATTEAVGQQLQKDV